MRETLERSASGRSNRFWMVLAAMPSSPSHSDPVVAAKLAAASIMSAASLNPDCRSCEAVSIAYCRNAGGEANLPYSGWLGWSELVTVCNVLEVVGRRCLITLQPIKATACGGCDSDLLRKICECKNWLDGNVGPVRRG